MSANGIADIRLGAQIVAFGGKADIKFCAAMSAYRQSGHRPRATPFGLLV